MFGGRMTETMLAMEGHHNAHILAWYGVDLPEPAEPAELLPWECPECGEFCPDDSRVEAGMKCHRCAYGCDAVDLADSCGLDVTDLYPWCDD